MRSVQVPPLDPALPRARELLLPGPSGAVLALFLERRSWKLDGSTPLQVVYWPGKSCAVMYRVWARSPSGRPREMVLCSEVRTRTRTPVPLAPDLGQRFGIAEPLEAHGGLLVWAYPYDPVLNGLSEAAHGPSVRATLSLRAPTAVSVSFLRYRPTRRAVLRYRSVGPGGRETFFGKVMRPGPLARTVEGYPAVARTGLRLSPPSVHPSIPGLALFPALSGSSLRDRLLDGGPLPAPRRVFAMLDRLATVRWRGPLKDRRHDRTVRAHGRLLAHLLPHRRGEITALAEELAEHVAAVRPGPVTHGDLYDAQILVEDDFSLGLIDLDDAGPGDPLLDMANLLTHLAALGESVPDAARRPLAYRALLRREILERFGMAEPELAWREALCMLLLAGGSFRSLSPSWPRTVEARVDAALRLRARSDRGLAPAA